MSKMTEHDSNTYERHVEETVGDYKVKKNRALDITARIVTFICAFFVWFYVVEMTDVTTEQDFNLIPIEIMGVESINGNGLIVQSMSFDTINVTLTGTKNDFRAITEKDIVAYIDIADIKEPGEYNIDVKIKVPTGFAPPAKETIVTVNVDKPDTAIYAITNENIKFDSWSIESNCSFDTENSGVNIDYVILEGTTLEIKQNLTIRIKTNAIGTINTNTNSNSVIEILNENGEVLQDTSIIATAYSGGEIIDGKLVNANVVSEIVVSVVLVKEKEVFLSLKDEAGYVSDSNIVIEPASVIVRGSPSAVDSLSEISIGSVNSRNIVISGNSTVYTDDFVYSGFGEGITEVKLTDGTKLENNTINAKANITVGETYELTIPAANIKIVEGDAILDVTSMKIKVRTVGDDTYYLLLKDRLESGEGGVTVVVNLSGINVVGKKVAPATIVFSSDFDGKLYAVEDAENPYTVTVRPNTAK